MEEREKTHDHSFYSTAAGLPEELEEMAAGAGLAETLEALDRRRLNGYDLVRMMQARARLISHLQAEWLADMVELSYAPAGSPDSPPHRQQIPDEFTPDELRAALR